LIFLLSCAAGWSQNVYGTIAGTVTDASGAVIGAATVTLTNLETGAKRDISTDASGNYTFPNILPGRYRIEVEKSGFKKFGREPIVVQIESGLRVDIALEVGAINQTVEVTAEAPLLQPQTSSLGQVVEQRTVTELPLNGRNPLALVGLTAGVVPQGAPSAGNSSMGNQVGANPFAAGDFQIGGGQAGQSQILIDGVPTNGAYLNVVTLIPTQDAVEEFKVQTNNLGPEYGRFAGGVINLSTKAGTNSFHGSLYEFLRNKVLNANDFFANAGGVPRPPFTQNQFGGNVGGPVLKDKLFFFSSYEGFRQRRGSILTAWMPTAAERSGDFSQIGSTGASSVLPIFDATTSANCTSGVAACRTAFTGNKIPANRIDPTAQALLNYFPLPNQVGNPSGNFAESFSTGGNIDQINERIDYSLSEKQRIFGRYSRSHVLSLPDSPFNQVCSDRCTEDTVANQVVLGDTILFSPKTILDLHVGYTRYVYVRTPLSQGIDLSQFGPNWAALGPQMTYTHIPTVCVSQISGDNRWGSGSWCSAGTGSGIGAYDDTLSFQPVLSKIIGNHNLKFGGEYRMLRNNYYQSNQPAGLFNFNAGMTAGNPNNGQPGATSGNGFASFLLGYGDPSGSNASEPAKTADQNLYGAIYAGDTWQVTRNLTLNLGLRVDLQGNWTERYDRIVVFNPGEASPLAGQVGMPNLKGAFDLVNSSNHSSRSAFPSWNHISPRLGLSYQLGRNTVIRTGYGIFYLPVDGRWDDAPHNLFINSITNSWLPAQADGVTPKNPLSNPFPGGIAPPPGRNQDFINVQGNGLEAPLGGNAAPYVQQWNFDIQHQLPGNTLFDIAYAGSKGTHLPMHNQDLNQLPPAFLPKNAADVAALTAQVPNPFYGTVQSGGVGANPTIKAGQLLLPFPQYDDVSMAEPDNRDSIYHSMQLKVQKRFAAGAQVLATYTVSKLIDNTNSEINWLEASPVSWNDSNSYNLRGERSLDAFDVPQRLVLASVLDLPIGRGKKFLNNVNGFANALLGGWGVDTIITFQSGFPVIISGCPGALGNAGIPNAAPCSRPTRTGPSHLTSGSLDDRLAHWFDTSVFTAGDPNVYNYGNDSRTEPNIRNDGVKNFDIGIFKNTKFGPDGRIGAEFRAELFNTFNRVQFNPPNTSCCGGSSFGQVTSQYNLPRVVQFALRMTF
jgi:Carboxypeptidase regulatory-like domain/TonB dependent receptor-like, beta-barrel